VVGLDPEGSDDFCSLPYSIDSGIVIQRQSVYRDQNELEDPITRFGDDRELVSHVMLGQEEAYLS
jgi:hypothetical protein